jgi:hypothetical protein
MKFNLINVTLSSPQTNQISRAMISKTQFQITLSLSQINESQLEEPVEGSFKLPLTSLQLNKLRKSLQLLEECRLEFHLIQLKEIAQLNFGQELEIDLLLYRRS